MFWYMLQHECILETCLVKIRQTQESKYYMIPCVSISIWNRQIHGDRKEIRDYQRLGEEKKEDI